MGSPTTLAFQAKRYSEASRFVSLIVGAPRSAERRGAGLPSARVRDEARSAHPLLSLLKASAMLYAF